MASKKALRPDFISQLPSLSRSETEVSPLLTDEERFLYGMSQTSGWNVFYKKAMALIADMDQLNDAAVASGASYEELGKNTIVVSLAKGIVRRLLATVDDAKEAYERQPK